MGLDAGFVFAFYHLSRFLRGAGVDGASLIAVLFAITVVLAAAAIYLLARFADKRYATIEI